MSGIIYKNKVDFRVLSDKLTFMFYVSNKNMNKKKWCMLSYDTTEPVDAFVQEEDEIRRLFLKFNKDHIKVSNYYTPLVVPNTDIIVEVFINSEGVFGFKESKNNVFGAFLTHQNYFNLTKTRTGGGQGAITQIQKPKLGKNHEIQMILPNLTSPAAKLNGLSFDMDILSEYAGQYTKYLGFKVGLKDGVIVEGEIPSTIVPLQTITNNKPVTLNTTYLTLTKENLADRQIRFDYKKVLINQDVDARSLELVESKIYTVENKLDPSINLKEFNLTDSNILQIPYNVSREVADDVVKTSIKMIKGGKEIYPIDWVSEIRDNMVFSSANKCLSLKFPTPEQLTSFTEKLKSQQIGSIETYPTLQANGTVGDVKRNYSKISQWIERSTLNQFNDVKFTYNSEGLIKNILICPRKKSNIGIDYSGRQNKLYTYGNEYILYGEDYVGEYNVDSDGEVTTGNQKTDQSKPLDPLYNTTPIAEFSDTDFCFTNFDTTDRSVMYSASTTGDTYDLNLTGSSFTGNTILPISNIATSKRMGIIGDSTKKYKAYAFKDVYSENGGYLNVDRNSQSNYMTYSAKTSGLYRFTYKAYLNMDYLDTKWCQYINNSYPSATTINYLNNNYDVKRLINTSIIQAGKNELEISGADTNFKYNTGTLKYYGDKSADNTGIKSFDFSVYINRVKSGSTSPTKIKEFKVLRSDIDGKANNYLTLQVTNVDKSISGFSVCNTNDVSATTIFNRVIPVTLDTGFINLGKGDKIQLLYNCGWESTSEYSGETSLRVQLGHKLDYSGGTEESPFFRGIKSSNTVVNKELFFDGDKKSKPFKMNIKGSETTVTLNGTLYMTDRGCDTIILPKVNDVLFNKLTFIDSDGKDDRLVWDKKSDKPTNNWQTLIESNKIKDYILTKKSEKKMGDMNENGIFSFNMPTYDSEFGLECDYQFPRTSQSYIVCNKFKNYLGDDFKHYIVVTPECGLHKPCSTNKPVSAYDILHKTTPDNWKLVNINKKITINGKEITVVSDISDYTNIIHDRPRDTSCQYYCKCGQDLSDKLNLDPMYGITKVLYDFEPEECIGCLKAASKYCRELNGSCEPILLSKCSDKNVYLSQVEDKNNQEIVTKGVLPQITIEEVVGTDVEVKETEDNSRYDCTIKGCSKSTKGDYRDLKSCEKECKKRKKKKYVCLDGICKQHINGDFNTLEECKKSCRQNVVTTQTNTTRVVMYSCLEGVCFEDPEGIYSSIDTCITNCETQTQEPRDEGEETITVLELRDDESLEVDKGERRKEKEKDSGVCPREYYWCEELRRCQHESDPCP